MSTTTIYSWGVYISIWKFVFTILFSSGDPTILIRLSVFLKVDKGLGDAAAGSVWVFISCISNWKKTYVFGVQSNNTFRMQMTYGRSLGVGLLEVKKQK